MVAEIRLYIEGGGSEEKTKKQFREGFHQFLSGIIAEARRKSIPFRLIPCGSRTAAYTAFCRALGDHSQAFNILLVDAERPVNGGAWNHVKAHDRWESSELGDEHCHLMVQVMEAWFLADGESLAGYYAGQGFYPNALPRAKDVETLDKETVLTSLKDATRKTKKGEYQKIKHASQLLGVIRPKQVREASRHCDLLFTTLEERIRAY
jgi:hypothetical protein